MAQERTSLLNRLSSPLCYVLCISPLEWFPCCCVTCYHPCYYQGYIQTVLKYQTDSCCCGLVPNCVNCPITLYSDSVCNCIITTIICLAICGCIYCDMGQITEGVFLSGLEEGRDKQEDENAKIGWL